MYIVEPKFDDSDRAADSTAIELSKNELKALADVNAKDIVASIRSANTYVQETKDNYSISFDVPGVKIQDVKLQVEDGVLQVTAERKAGDKTVSKLVQHFVLDDNVVDASQMNASLADGVLTITAPKKEEPAPVVVPVSSSEPSDVDSNGLVLTLDVPGIKRTDLEIEFHKGTVSIRGERTSVSTSGKRQVVSKLNRVFQVKEKLVDTSKIQAFLADGVLTVTAPSKPTQPAKQITIPTAARPKAEDKAIKAAGDDEVVVETVTNEDEQ
jgi:HSP20 family molecular chaperone IbpA